MDMEIVGGVLAAFGGGVMGAVLGALPMFIMTGFVGFVGAALQMGGADLGGVFVNDIVFGPLTGPHVAFAGGVAAAAFAAHRLEILESGSDILTPLFKTKSASVMLVGGVFGVIGHLACVGLVQSGYPGNPVATALIISGVLVRVMFGHKGLATLKSVKEKETAVLEKAKKERVGFLDMKESGMNLVVAIGIGLLFSSVCMKSGVMEFGFYFSAISLVMLQFGYAIPLTHHITLTCGAAAVISGSLFTGVIFAVIAWIVGELWQKFVNERDDTWLDTPSASISICSFGLLLL